MNNVGNIGITLQKSFRRQNVDFQIFNEPENRVEKIIDFEIVK